MREFIDIGGAPYEEECAQVGERFERGTELNRLECRAYIAALRKVYGPEPDGAELRLHRNPHEFGTYYEVRCVYDTAKPDSVAYSDKVEAGLKTWEEANMWRPVTYDDQGNPWNVLTDERCWDREANPTCLPELPSAAAWPPA